MFRYSHSGAGPKAAKWRWINGLHASGAAGCGARAERNSHLPMVSFETKLAAPLRESPSMKRYVHFPKVEGQASRQAQADLPPGTFEREISKEGFFGPAAHLYHRHPPTGWVDFQGPLRPHAFDCTKLAGPQDSPWSAPELLHNASVRLRFWRCEKRSEERRVG